MQLTHRDIDVLRCIADQCAVGTDVLHSEFGNGSPLRRSGRSLWGALVKARARRALLLVLVFLVGSSVTDAKPGLAVQPRLELASADRAGRPLGSQNLQMPPALDRTGRFVLFVSRADGIAPGDADGQLDLFRKDLATGKIDWISPGVTGDASNGDISADGRFVAFYADRTYVRDVRRGVTTVVDDRAPLPIDAPAISDDGNVVAFVEGGKVRVADPTTGPNTGVHVADGLSLDLTPDGRWLVFHERDDRGERIVRLDRHSGERVTIYEGLISSSRRPFLPFVDAGGSAVSFSVWNGFMDVDAFIWESGVVQPLSDAPLSSAGQLSDDGRRVLVAEAAAFDVETAEVVVLDRPNGAMTTLGSANEAWGISLSRDGTTVSWSTASGLVAGDDNGATDVYATRLRRP